MLLFLHPVHAQDDSPSDSQATAVPISQRVAELDLQIAEIDQRTVEARAEWEQLKNEVADLKLKLSFLEGRLHSLDASRQVHQAEVEKLLKESGEWISFGQQIAPIFQNHCIACHNARNPQGQYNMSHYAALMSQGESGSAVVVGRAEESSLWQMIADGSMPKDGPALSSHQIDLVRKWIDQGARLDSGIASQTPLFRLAPRSPHPPAPERYPASLPITAVAVSPGNELIATSGYHEVLLWSSGDGQLRRRIGNVAQRVYGLAFHSDGQRLAVASGTPGRVGELKLLSVDSGEVLADLWVSHDSVTCLAFSPDGRFLACGDTTGSVAIFDLQGPIDPRWIRQDHTDWVQSLAWSSDGRRIVTASRDKTCKVLDSQTGELRMTWNGHQEAVVAAAFSHDGQQVISAGQDATLRIWRIDDGKQVHHLKELGREINGLVLLEAPHLLVFSAENQLKEVDILQGKVTKSQTVPTADNLSAATFSDGGRQLALGSYSGRVSIVDGSASHPSQESNSNSWLAQPTQAP